MVAAAAAKDLAGMVSELVSGRDRQWPGEEGFSGALSGKLSGRRQASGREYNLEVGYYKRSDETKVGADLWVLLEIEFGRRTVRKGILLQAKSRPAGADFTKDRQLKLLDQCEAMWRESPDGSFVVVYGSELVVFPGSKIRAHKGSIASLSAQSLESFLTDFFICRKGTRYLGERLRRDPTLARRGLDVRLAVDD